MRRDLPTRARGQSFVEFVLLAPVLMLLLLVAIDFGRLMYTYIAVHNAAREGAAYAALHASDGASDSSFSQAAYEAGITAAALREANVQGQSGEGSLTVSSPSCFPTSDCHAASLFAPGIGNQVTVTASQPFSFATPLVTDIVGGQLDLTASATAPILNPIDISIIPDPDPGPSCPTVSFGWEVPDPAGEPLTVSFTNTTTGGSSEQTWDYGDGSQPVTLTASSHDYTYDATGTYTVTLTVDDCMSPPGAVTVDDGSGDPGPSETDCEVPDFVGSFWSNVGGVPAQQVWAGEGFTGKLKNRASSNEIQSQTLTPGLTVACTSDMDVSDKA